MRAGTLPMAAWANLSGLTYFTVRNNSMTGTLPDELATAWPKLEHLDLNWNRFAGAVPEHMHTAARVWGGLSVVKAGKACASQLTREAFAGTIPRAWSALPLQFLDVSNNSLAGARP